jgi:hypothetical protein
VGPAINLYAGYTDTWTFTDPAPGGVGDTTRNWHTESLAVVLEGIPGLPDGAVLDYILTAGNENMPPKAIYHTGAVTLTIDGGGRTVTLSEAGSLMIIGNGVTLKLKNIILRGQGLNVDNTFPLIQVVIGGTLELKDGAVITGNNRNGSAGHDAYGGGVDNAGTFIMSGGAIAGNMAFDSPLSFLNYNACAYGGGVYNTGTFTMRGGTITDNTARGHHSCGGGVYNTGTFTMSGGTITGNTAKSVFGHAYGGGVDNAGTFTMSGGTITGNTAESVMTSSYGGGVNNLERTFTMSGGAITGNTAKSVTSNAYGGGVSSREGTSIMSRGAIAGNTAESISSNTYGGGVYLFRENFTKNGGIIYGDDGTETGNTAGSGNGHAVYLEENTKCRNSTAGPAINLYVEYTNDTWTFTDPATGEDTTGNWE